MKREEFIQMIIALESMYPNMKVSQNDFTVEIWYGILGHISMSAMESVIKKHVSQSKFQPTANELITHYNELTETEPQMSEVEAWGIVKKAIRNATYNSKSEFEKLPDIIQKTIGSADVLRSWAMEESDNTDKVTGSNFMRSFRDVHTRDKQFKALPNDVKQLISTNGVKLIGE
jgi:hypothetical protein